MFKRCLQFFLSMFVCQCNERDDEWKKFKLEPGVELSQTQGEQLPPWMIRELLLENLHCSWLCSHIASMQFRRIFGLWLARPIVCDWEASLELYNCYCHWVTAAFGLVCLKGWIAIVLRLIVLKFSDLFLFGCHCWVITLYLSMF